MPKTEYVWDELSDNVIEEYEDGVLSVSYDHEPGLYGNLLSQNRNGVTSYYHYDGRGDTVALTDDSGNVTATKEYDAWGNVIAATGSTVTPYLFGGRQGYQTGNTGVYIRARMLQPISGRWTSRDPLLPKNLQTSFVFVTNSPVWLMDPSGLIEDKYPWYLPDPKIFSQPPFFPVMKDPPFPRPRLPLEPFPRDPEIDPTCKVKLCEDMATWTKDDCPCPCSSTKIGGAPVTDALYREEFFKSLRSLGIDPSTVKLEVKDICVPGKPGISVTCPRNLTASNKLYVCLAKGTYDSCDAAALALHEAMHVMQLESGQRIDERAAYRRQCQALYEQSCCDSQSPDSRGCYGPPFMNPPRQPNAPIPSKDELIAGCVRNLLPQSTGPGNQTAIQQFCQQH